MTAAPNTGISQPVSTLQAALGAFVVEAGNAAVAFGAFGATTATTVEAAVTGLIAIAFVVANEFRHNTLAKAGLLER